MNKRNLINKKFGRLLVVEEFGKNKKHSIVWKCKCDCGNYKNVVSSNLISGKTKSCGCLHIESITKHGGSKTKLYKVWHSMKERCKNKKQKTYIYYGGRGIKVCKEWEDSFYEFREWSFKNGYSEGMSIDRKENDGDYEPNNCRWTNMTVQARNKNLGKNNKSGTKGVSFSKAQNKYSADITVNYKHVFLGYYEFLEDAVKARKKAEVEYWREKQC